MAKKLIHICEVCGKTEILTPEEAFNDGWDYPPRMGGFRENLKVLYRRRTKI